VSKWFALWLLFAINTMNFFDRQILGAVTEPIRKEWGLTDTQMGWLGTSFTLLYAFVGVPLGRLADVWRRKWLLTLGLTVWSGLTYISGLCGGFWSLFAVRLGVGVGEAACAPTSSSLIGDLFRPEVRARAMSIFMVGLPLGVALSYIVSGTVAQHLGWRAAFFVAGLPGLALAGLALFMREPPRGQTETSRIGTARRAGSPYLLVLGIPTMWWIIASGALHNFNMYAIGNFLPAFLVRYHEVSIQTAGFISGIVIGCVGALGMLIGGWAGDAMRRRRPNGRMLVAAAAIAVSAPAAYLALNQPRGALIAFILFQGVSSMLMYVYYAAVYSTIHDIVEPSLRGTGMALYFFAMYVLGASFGPLVTGWASDHFAREAAASAGMLLAADTSVPEQFRAAGLHHAMYMVPILGIALAAVLAAGSVTVGKDMRNLQDWMHRITSRSDPTVAE
jgi:MFS family permease